ncbi:MAG: hypothetical protein ABI867_32200 [Kofleriaceae bacterium]
MFRLLSSTCAVSLLVSLPSCRRSGDDGDAEAIEEAADSTQMSQAEATLLASAIDGSTGTAALPASAESAAAFIAARAPERYAPSGCVTVTQAQTTVTLAFAGCTGPRGLRRLDGTLVLAVSAGAGGAVIVEASATDFQIGASTLAIAATATYSVEGATASLAVQTTSSGVGPLGYAIEHDGDYVTTWDGSCVSIDGAWSTQRGDLSRSTTAEVTRCLEQCPEGTVTRTTIDDRVIELTFDGTTTARWSTSRGATGSFPLACGI